MAAYFGASGAFFPVALGVIPVQGTPSFQSSSLLAKAWALPVARTFVTRFAYQRNGSTCGPTSLADVERSWGFASDERSILDGTGKCRSGLCLGGLSLDDFAAVARRKTEHRVSVLRTLSDARFGAFLPSFKRSLAPVHRELLSARVDEDGAGHLSPIGGYLADEDLVFVLDVNERWKPWLVNPERPFAAIDTVSSDGKRGLLLLE